MTLLRIARASLLSIHNSMSKPPGLERRIREDLEAEIRTGRWPPGHRLPTEAELTARYGCARMTVNRAITALAAAGLVTRNKRAGTRVLRPPVAAPVLAIPDLASQIESRGQTYGFQLGGRRMRPLDPTDPAESALAAAGEVLELSGAHLSGGEPFAIEDRLILLASAPKAAEIDFTRADPGAWLLREVPFTAARHRITAIAAGSAEASRLGVRRGAALLSLERWTWINDTGVTHARQLFPGDRYDLVGEFGPGRPGD